MDEPLPVRTVLAVIEGGTRRALEVTRVVEVAERDERGRRGIYGRWVGDDALARAMKVGTEHLEDGTPQVQPVSPDDSGSAALSDGTSMAMPAPVMISVDDTGVIDVNDREDADEGSDDAEESSEASEESSEASEESSEATEESGDATEESGERASTEESADQGDGRKSRGGRRKRGRRKK
jgi:hypothetical protein